MGRVLVELGLHMLCSLLNASRFGTVASSPSSASRDYVLQKVGVLKVKLQVMFWHLSQNQPANPGCCSATNWDSRLPSSNFMLALWMWRCLQDKALLLLSQQALEICHFEDQDQVQAC